MDLVVDGSLSCCSKEEEHARRLCCSANEHINNSETHSVFPRRSTCTIWSLGCSSIAMNLDEPYEIGSTPLRHLQMRDKTTQPPNACSQGTASHRLHSLIAIEIARHMPVVTPYWEQGRTGDRALLHGVRAAGAEATARRRVHRIRGIPQKRQMVEAVIRIHRGG